MVLLQSGTTFIVSGSVVYSAPTCPGQKGKVTKLFFFSLPPLNSSEAIIRALPDNFSRNNEGRACNYPKAGVVFLPPACSRVEIAAMLRSKHKIVHCCRVKVGQNCACNANDDDDERELKINPSVARV